jgi:hypothetical protein
VGKSVYDSRQERHHRSITRPKVLLVVGHPSIGAALEELLRIEDRYEVRRAQSLEQVGSGLDGWAPDLALVDGLVIQEGRTAVLSMPTIVLSGNPYDGRSLSGRVPRGRGWLRKDATADEIRTAIDRVVAPAARRWPALLVAGALVLTVIVIGIAWYLLGPRG